MIEPVPGVKYPVNLGYDHTDQSYMAFDGWCETEAEVRAEFAADLDRRNHVGQIFSVVSVELIYYVVGPHRRSLENITRLWKEEIEDGWVFPLKHGPTWWAKLICWKMEWTWVPAPGYVMGLYGGVVTELEYPRLLAERDLRIRNRVHELIAERLMPARNWTPGEDHWE